MRSGIEPQDSEDMKREHEGQLEQDFELAETGEGGGSE